MSDWKTKSSKIVFQNSRFSIREDQIIRPDGTDGAFFVMDRAPVVVIVPISKNNEIYFISINRYTTRQTHWELPAGSSDNQNELFAAQRELKEETGLTSENWEKIGEIEVAPGMTGQTEHVYVAKDVRQTNENEQEKENIKKVKKIEFQKVLTMIKTGKIVNGPTISALTAMALKLKLIP